jgi:hypothetical protein
MKNPTAALIDLRNHYQNIVAQSELQATEARVQIEHIDSLLVNVFVQSQEIPTQNVVVASSALPVLAIRPQAEVPEESAISSVVATESSQDVVVSAKPGRPRKAKASKPPKISRPPLTQPKSKTAATKKTTSSPKTSKTTTKVSKTKTEAKSDESLALVPTYAGLNKLEAITKVLTEQAGHVLHQDTILQLLYGDISPEQLIEAGRRMRASLYQGVTKGLWEKAPKQRSSYWVKSSNGRKPQTAPEKPAASPKSVKPKRQLKASTSTRAKQASVKAPAKAAVKVASRGRAQVLSLPPQYTGLSKIEAVAKVLEENPGQVMHMENIIERLYGTLPETALTAEKVRMKDVMKRGIERKLWRKAPGVPSSIILGEATATPAAKPAAKKPGRKPKAAAPKTDKAAAQKSPKQTKRKRAELVALLRQADIKV